MRKYRYLFDQLVRRELKQKYKGTFVGVLWYLVNPLVLMGVYGVMLGDLLHAVSVHDYLVFILSGLLVWLFFSQALSASSTSLVEQAGLIGKVAFPRAMVPAATVVVQLIPMLTILVVLVPLSAILQGVDLLPLLVLPLVMACLFAFTIGFALVASSMNAHFRDVQPIITAALLPWFFVSGVLFNIASLPGANGHGARHVLEQILRWGDPIAPFVTAFRDVIYGGAWPSAAVLIYVVVAAAASLSVGSFVFRRLSAELAVVI
jgi:homopolymeric O-antigen transport system permease protein